MLENVARRLLRAVFGGGADISSSNPLPVTAETALDHGTATGGTIGTLQDTTKGWQVNIWEDALVEILDVSTGIAYTRELDSNTADTLNFATNPLPAAVVAGDTYTIRRVVSPLNPLARAEVHNAAIVGGVDILGAALAPLNTPCRFAVEVAFDAAGVFSVRVTRGGIPVGEEFNHGVVLTANSLFRFSHLVHAGDTINYQYSVNATMLSMRVQEIVAAA